MENKVTVKIYGQEYTISGEKSDEEIRRIAEYVDSRMHLIGRIAADYSGGSIAILSAVNIAEEYFDALSQIEQLKISKTQLENDSKYYLKMWEDAKKNNMHYKDNMSELKSQQKAHDDQVKTLTAKCAEYENSFFDLQMENIQLKSELEKLKNNR